MTVSESTTLEGIVLSRRSFAEADLSVTLFTKQCGKISVVARGARKSASKLAGVTEPGIEGEFQVITGHSRYLLGQVVPHHSRIAVHRKYELLLAMLYMLEIIDAVAPPNVASDSLYRLLQFGLGMIDQSADPVSAVATVQCLVLHSQGISPRLGYCMSCGNGCDDEAGYISMGYGGQLCGVCVGHAADAIGVSAGAARIWSRLMRYESVKGSGMEDWSSLLLASHKAIRNHIGHELKNWSLFIDAVEVVDA